MRSNYYLLSPKIDFILIGGAATLTYFLVLIFYTNFEFSIAWQGEVAYWMLFFAFFVNSPHFLISYLIFYRENSKNFKILNKYSIVGLYIPLFLLVFIILGLLSLNKSYFDYLLFSMFFLVGWHYIKQAYGCFIVYSAGNKIYYNKKEQNIIKLSLYPLWIFSFLNLFTNDALKEYWGFKYYVPNILENFKPIIEYCSIIGFLALISLFIYHIFYLKNRVNITAIISLIVIFIWLSPLFWNPYFYLMIPFFHSLQYFLFSGAYTKTKINKEENKKSAWLSWWGIAFILGALLFDFLPNFLDSNLLTNNNLTSHLFLICFILFINIHHYFIDSVIWRGGNKDVRDNLKFISKT